MAAGAEQISRPGSQRCHAGAKLSFSVFFQFQHVSTWYQSNFSKGPISTCICQRAKSGAVDRKARQGKHAPLRTGKASVHPFEARQVKRAPCRPDKSSVHP
eukprot:1159212-Pelagomonas_calceolata.AAC.10